MKIGVLFKKKYLTIQSYLFWSKIENNGKVRSDEKNEEDEGLEGESDEDEDDGEDEEE